jgi:hypothetical protein
MADISAFVAAALLDEDQKKGVAYLQTQLSKGPSPLLRELLVEMLGDGRLSYKRKRRGRPSAPEPMAIAKFHQTLREAGEKHDYARDKAMEKFKVGKSTVDAALRFAKKYEAYLEGIQFENQP